MSRSARRGSTATTVALSLGASLGFTAITVDLGTAFLGRAQIQNALDAGALGGSAYFDGSPNGVSTATTKATDLVAANTALGKPVTVTLVETGVTTNGTFVASTNAATINSLRLTGQLTGIAAPFGALWGSSTLTASTRSSASQGATGPAGASKCFLPIAIPKCVMNSPSTYENTVWQMSSANNDNAGWADLSQNPTKNTVAAQLSAGNFCAGTTASASDDVYLNNGVIDPSLQSIADAINSSSTSWNTTKYGNIPNQMSNSLITSYGQTIEGPIILFDDKGAGTCGSGLQFNQTKKIVGFVWGVVFDSSKQGATKNIHMHLDLTHTISGGSAGGGLSGTVTYTEPPVLVQ